MNTLAANEPLLPLSVYGAGYVGLVTAACFAELGHVVLCMDADAARVAQLARGQLPFVEPGLEDLVVRNGRRGRLRFTHDADAAVTHGAVQFIAVGTPCHRDGTADIRQVLEVARRIGAGVQRETLVVCKSTVPVGTTERVRQMVQHELERRGLHGLRFAAASNPEFLKEGSAVDDFMRPDRVVAGSDDPRAIELLRTLYAPLIERPEQWLAMETRGAELTKYACNAMLASRVSVMNEFAQLAEALEVDIEDVRKGMAGDPRIGPMFLSPGCGFGGSCLPKDIRALQRTALDHGVALPTLAAVEQTNQHHKGLLALRAIELFGGSLAGRRIALWGLAFKPGTDDLREAPSEVLIGMLAAAGATVVAHDPVAMPAARRQHGHVRALHFARDMLDAVDGADALLIATEWPEYRRADWVAVHARMARPQVLDGRNICDPARMAALGFAYRGIGRGQSEKFAAIPSNVQPRLRDMALRPPLPTSGATRVNAASRA
ncbi:MAG: UDP-glucose/GDP-mannose dehydrogenase family protein [Burkholderiaceae bacterium]|nr:UDP-glucose/GDP-mannose dehydrogenase family protein [Burkholderiaceae bacterium]